jgi:hypothetical protein
MHLPLDEHIRMVMCFIKEIHNVHDVHASDASRRAENKLVSGPRLEGDTARSRAAIEKTAGTVPEREAPQMGGRDGGDRGKDGGDRGNIEEPGRPGDYGRFESGTFRPPEGWTLDREPAPGIAVYKDADRGSETTMLAHDDYQRLNPVEYQAHNFAVPGEMDKEGIARMVEAAKRLGITPGSLESAVDCGANTNVYGAMILAPLVREGGRLEVHEVSNPAREFQKAVYDTQGRNGLFYMDKDNELWVVDNTLHYWPPFSDHIKGLMNTDKEPLAEAQRKVTEIGPKTLQELPRGAFDLTMSNSVLESIATDRSEFFGHLADQINTAKPEGGATLVSGMLNSTGWEYGTTFSAARLTPEYLKSAIEGGTVTDNHGQVHYLEPVITGLRDARVDWTSTGGTIGSTSTGLYVLSARRSGEAVHIEPGRFERLEAIYRELDPVIRESA